MGTSDYQSSLMIPDLLFHTILTVIDYPHDASGASRTIFVLNTHGVLEAAKSYAAKALEELQFTPGEFQKYIVRSQTESDPDNKWTSGDGVFVFARSFDGQEFRVSIYTTSNNESLVANAQTGEMILPEGARFLHYVLQTTVDYHFDRSGGSQQTDIQGVYLHRADAWTAAHKCLDGRDFAEYDSRGDAEFVEQWPFGDSVAVHAVSDLGENYFIAVTTPPQKQGDVKKHGMKRK